MQKVRNYYFASPKEKLAWNKLMKTKSEYWSTQLLDLNLVERAKRQRDIEDKVEKGYQWKLVTGITQFLALYSVFDFLLQVCYQFPFFKAPDGEGEYLQHIGLRKIYNQSENFGYDAMIADPDNYQGFTVNINNILLQMFNCIILNLISMQAEIFKGEGFYRFVTGKFRVENIPASEQIAEKCSKCNKTSEMSQLNLFMTVADIKQKINDYDFNNEKLRKIVAIQKTQHQILQTVERIKLNVFLWRKSQQRAMLHEWYEAARVIGDKQDIKAPLLYNYTATKNPLEYNFEEKQTEVEI